MRTPVKRFFAASVMRAVVILSGAEKVLKDETHILNESAPKSAGEKTSGSKARHLRQTKHRPASPGRAPP